MGKTPNTGTGETSEGAASAPTPVLQQEAGPENGRFGPRGAIRFLLVFAAICTAALLTSQAIYHLAWRPWIKDWAALHRALPLLFLEMLPQYACLAAGGFILVRWMRAPLRDVAPMRFRTWPLYALILFSTGPVVVVANQVVAAVDAIYPIPPDMEAFFEDLIVPSTGAEWVGTIATLALLAPAIEEALFRGVLFRGLERAGLGPASVVVTQAAVFSLYHLIPWQIAATFTVGLYLGYLRLRTGSLLPCLFAHAIYNLLLVLVGSQGIVAETPEGTEPESAFLPWSLTAGSILLGGALLLFIHRITKQTS